MQDLIVRWPLRDWFLLALTCGLRHKERERHRLLHGDVAPGHANRIAMVDADIPAAGHLFKRSISLVPSAFEQWASSRNYDIAPAVLHAADRVYADRSTQEAFDAWNAGAQSIARVFTDSTFETEAFRERIRKLAGSE